MPPRGKLSPSSDGPVVCDFIETFMRVTRGRDAGTNLRLRPWQRELLTDLYELRTDGRRRYRRALIGMPRKQGKSALASGLALYGLFDENGSEVYSAAGDREQARIVFAEAKRAVEADRELSASLRVYKDAIELPSTHSVYRVLSAEAYCVVPETPVEMCDGTRLPIGEVLPGEAIVGVDNGAAVYDHVSSTGRRVPGECVTVRTHRGREVTATTDHPFLVRQRDYKGPDTLTWRAAGDLVVGDRVVVGLGWPDDYEGKPLAPNEAWTMGAWVGDGCNTRFRLTNIDVDIINGVGDFFRSIGSDLVQDRHTPLQWNVIGVGKRRRSPGREWVREHFGVTLARDKRVPRAVMTATPADWASFLAGYMDTDGCVVVDRPHVNWTSASVELLRDCRALLARLGFNATLSPTYVVYKGERRTYWQLRVCGAGQVRRLRDVLSLRHPEKLAKLSRDLPVDVAPFRSWDSDRVVAVEPAGQRETVALSVAHTSAHITDGLVTHNTKEGLNPSLVVFDEVHVQPNDELWNTMQLGMGTREQPLMLGITTAGVKYDTSGAESLCYRLWQYGRRVEAGEIDDPSFFFRWWGAPDGADYRDPDVWRAANPALGDFLHIEDFESTIRTTPENEFRTKRLDQWVSAQNAWLPTGAWDACTDTDTDVHAGTEIVLGFDGSFNGDSTALVGCTTGPSPHVFVVECWEKPDSGADDWQVPIVDVEDAIRKACKRYRVREIACDPYRWARSMQVLEAERLPVVEFPQNQTRMTPATTRFYEAVVNNSLTHDGDKRLARHIGNAVLKTDSRGSRLSKDRKGSARRIDLAVCAVMALERSQHAQTQREFWGSWA